MIYHKHSLVGYMLWLRYAMLAGKPWRSLTDIYANHLESPGTKAYTLDEAHAIQEIFGRENFHGAYPRRLAGIRCRATPSELVAVPGEMYLAAPSIAVGIAEARPVHADRDEKVTQFPF